MLTLIQYTNLIHIFLNWLAFFFCWNLFNSAEFITWVVSGTHYHSQGCTDPTSQRGSVLFFLITLISFLFTISSVPRHHLKPFPFPGVINSSILQKWNHSTSNNSLEILLSFCMYQSFIPLDCSLMSQDMGTLQLPHHLPLEQYVACF